MATPNFADKTIWTGDCLYVLRGMNSECVDLIYVDPPFNSKANYAAPIGSQAAGAAFKDTWTLSDVDAEWVNLIEAKYPALHRVLLAAMTDSDKSYLVYMAARILEMRRVLKPTGSIYLHCDPTMSHYLKLVMDAVFRRANFVSEVVWKRQSSHNRAKRWGPIHDTILMYSGEEQSTWNRVLQPLDPEYLKRFYRHQDTRGRYRVSDLTGPGLRDGDTGQTWHDIDPSERGRHWELPPDRALPEWFVFPEGYAAMSARQRLDVLDDQGLLYWPPRGTMPGFKRYLTPTSGAPVTDLVLDIPPLSAGAKERIGYPTQKPLALLERIIKASSNPGEIVLDPFCGCATTMVAADRLERQWAGIDLSPIAGQLVLNRIRDDRGPMFNDVIHRTDIPLRTDLGDLPPYRTHKLTLYGLQVGNCGGCGQHFEARHLEVDHIISRAKGGTDHIDNLQLLCGSCNRIKGNRGMEYLRTRLQL